MHYSKMEIGEALKIELNKGYELSRIANLADSLFHNSREKISPELSKVLYELCLMNAGPEFAYSKQELLELADKLILEGEKEELAQPIPGIKEAASKIDDNWLMCPICQEVWETCSEYGMVFCPGCNNKLHNPRFKI